MALLSETFGARTVRVMVNVVNDVSGLEGMAMAVYGGGGGEHKEMIMRFNQNCILLVS